MGRAIELVLTLTLVTLLCLPKCSNAQRATRDLQQYNAVFRPRRADTTTSQNQATVTILASDTVSEVTANSATLPTPITTTARTKQVPLYVPAYDPLVTPTRYNVQYLGPGNGHSTVYEVVYSANADRGPVTATLVEDASNARLVGAQQETVINGVSTNVWAAVTCGFQDGLRPTAANPAPGYCVYYNNANHVTSSWTTAITQIQPQTTITALPGAVQQSVASVASVHGSSKAKKNGQSTSYQVCAVLVNIFVALGAAFLLA